MCLEGKIDSIYKQRIRYHPNLFENSPVYDSVDAMFVVNNFLWCYDVDFVVVVILLMIVTLFMSLMKIIRIDVVMLLL